MSTNPWNDSDKNPNITNARTQSSMNRPATKPLYKLRSTVLLMEGSGDIAMSPTLKVAYIAYRPLVLGLHCC